MRFPEEGCVLSSPSQPRMVRGKTRRWCGETVSVNNECPFTEAVQQPAWPIFIPSWEGVGRVCKCHARERVCLYFTFSSTKMMHNRLGGCFLQEGPIFMGESFRIGVSAAQEIFSFSP